jgi:hypothetical protein
MITHRVAAIAILWMILFLVNLVCVIHGLAVLEKCTENEKEIAWGFFAFFFSGLVISAWFLGVLSYMAWEWWKLSRLGGLG